MVIIIYKDANVYLVNLNLYLVLLRSLTSSDYFLFGKVDFKSRLATICFKPLTFTSTGQDTFNLFHLALTVRRVLIYPPFLAH